MARVFTFRRGAEHVSKTATAREIRSAQNWPLSVSPILTRFPPPPPPTPRPPFRGISRSVFGGPRAPPRNLRTTPPESQTSDLTGTEQTRNFQRTSAMQLSLCISRLRYQPLYRYRVGPPLTLELNFVHDIWIFAFKKTSRASYARKRGIIKLKNRSRVDFDISI